MSIGNSYRAAGFVKKDPITAKGPTGRASDGLPVLESKTRIAAGALGHHEGINHRNPVAGLAGGVGAGPIVGLQLIQSRAVQQDSPVASVQISVLTHQLKVAVGGQKKIEAKIHRNLGDLVGRNPSPAAFGWQKEGGQDQSRGHPAEEWSERVGGAGRAGGTGGLVVRAGGPAGGAGGMGGTGHQAGLEGV